MLGNQDAHRGCETAKQFCAGCNNIISDDSTEGVNQIPVRRLERVIDLEVFRACAQASGRTI